MITDRTIAPATSASTSRIETSRLARADAAIPTRLPRSAGRPATGHRPGERGADIDHLEATLEQADERPARPVIEVPGCVAEVPQVLQAGHVEGPPQRLPWDADDRPWVRKARHDRERGMRVCEVLHHLAADDQLRGVPRGVELLHRGGAKLHHHAGSVRAPL